MLSPSAYSLWLGVHLGTVAISLVLFLFRLIQDQRRRDWRQRWPWLRWLPHLNDTVLLTAGVALCVVAGWRPWWHGWLALKLVLLVAYVLLGKRALAPGRPITARRGFGLAALVSVALMIFLALAKPF